MNSTIGPELVSERLAQVSHRIADAGREPGLVRVVAVTKGFGTDAVRPRSRPACSTSGRTTPRSSCPRLGAAPANVRWHFLGELQRNKLSRLAPHVFLWHGLDSVAEAEALAGRRPAAAVLVEVKLGGNGLRHGVSLEEAPGLVTRAGAAGLDVQGLMAVAPPRADRDEVRQGFRAVARLAGSLGLRELSMGMSGDFELAVAEGATMVRLGRALFGSRPSGSPEADVPGGARPG